MRRILSISALTAITLVFFAVAPNVSAQPALQLQKTDNPRAYLKTLLDDVAENGAAPLQEFLTKLGINPAQNDALVAALSLGFQSGEPATVKIIEEIDNAGILRQVYGYSHFGHNAWMFWRLDFVKTDDEWTVSGFQFNSEYSAVLAPKFKTAEVIK